MDDPLRTAEAILNNQYCGSGDMVRARTYALVAQARSAERQADALERIANGFQVGRNGDAFLNVDTTH